MENKTISQIALEKIKESGIKPISKNIFSIKRVLFWSLVGFSLIVGAVSFSVILSLLFNNDWDLYNKFGFSFIFKTLPYFWFISMLFLAVLGEIYYRKTLLGYRHRTVMIVLIYMAITVIFGSALYFTGIGDIVDESLSENVPVYHGIMFDKNEFWSHPESGLISGQITSIDGNNINIMDFNNNVWFINMDNAVVMGKTQIKEGEFVKIVGDADDNNIFNATQIRPWIGNKLNQVNQKGNPMR